MTASYRRTATVEFAINGTDQRITLNDLPYIWTPAVNPDMDQEAIFAAMDYMRANVVMAGGLNVICVTTSPVKEQ